MCILTEKTEFRTLMVAAQTLHHFRKLETARISAGDAIRLRHAENIVKDVIGNNGYSIIYKNNSIAIKKDKEQ